MAPKCNVERDFELLPTGERGAQDKKGDLFFVLKSSVKSLSPLYSYPEPSHPIWSSSSYYAVLYGRAITKGLIQDYRTLAMHTALLGVPATTNASLYSPSETHLINNRRGKNAFVTIF